MPKVDWFITELNVKGGAERFVFSIAPRMLDNGWQIRIITLQKGGEFLQQLNNLGIPCIELGLSSPSRMPALFRLNRLWADTPPDILHTHLYHAGIIGRILAKKANIPIVVVHQHGLERNRRKIRSLSDRIFSCWVTHYVASCTAVSEILQKRERISPSKISVVYNGVAVSGSLESPSYPKAFENNGSPHKPLIIGTIGRLEPEKGHEELIRGFAQFIARKSLSDKLWIIGGGSQQKRLVKITDELGIKENVSFFGSQEFVTPYLSKMDLFILPSRWEGMSMALLEAMSLGIPVIATGVGGTPEVITHGIHGWTIPPSDPGAISQAIELLRENQILRQQLGAQGRQRVAEKFTLEKTLFSLDRLYKRLVS